jgi:hypothetical protein
MVVGAQWSRPRFLLDRGKFTTITVPGAVGTSPSGIDNHGRIVGAYFDALGRPTASSGTSQVESQRSTSRAPE